MKRHMTGLLALVAGLLLPALAGAQLEPQPGERALQQVALQPVLVEPPALTAQVNPIFPEEEKARGGSGAVVLRLTIDDHGRVDRVEVVESAGRIFDWAALGAATNLAFRPARFVMQPVEGEPLPLCASKEQEAMGGCVTPFAAAVQLDYRMAFELSVAPEPPPAKPKPPTAQLMGLLREAGSKRPLEGVEIVVEVKGPVDEAFTESNLQALSTWTDAEGRFAIEGIPIGTHQVLLALDGYEPASETETFAADEQTQVIYYLVRRSYSKFTTVVRVKRPPKEVNKIALRREEVTKVPGTFGDPLRVIENLPGLARAGAFGGALLVRGSNPSDSGVYYDGVEIPILYHFGGLTSVINAEFLEDIDFYPGGFGARYGRATAGIVEVSSRSLDEDVFRGSGEVDLLDSGFFFTGPIDIGQVLGLDPAPPGPSPQKISFAAAARRSYIDALLPFVIETFLPPEQGVLTASPVYWDYQTKVEYRPHRNHRIAIMAFGSDDNLRIIARGKAEDAAQDFQLAVHQNFHRLLLSYDAQIGSHLANKAVLYGGYTGFDLGAASNDNIDGKVVADGWISGLRDELTVSVLAKAEVALGVDMQVGTGSMNFRIPFAPTAGTYPRVIPNLEGETAISEEDVFYLPAAYMEARLGPWAGLTLIPGFRFDGYMYGDAQRRFTAEPRLTARWQVTRGTTLKAAFGIYEQLAQLLQLSDKIGNPDLDLPRALHYIVGYEHQLTEKLSLDVELYFNDKDRLVVSSDRATLSGGQLDLEFYNNDGIGRSYGVEVLLRHELSRDFFGWVAYTLSRSESRNADQRRASPNARGAKLQPWYVTSFDQTHILTLVGQYRPTLPDVPGLLFHLGGGKAPSWLVKGFRVVTKDWSLGARFRLVTGNPTTPVRFAEHDLDTDSWDVTRGANNSARLPTFNQLDVRVDRKLVFDNFVVNLYLDLLNATNTTNVESMINDYRYRQQVPLTGLPIIPVIGLQGEF